MDFENFDLTESTTTGACTDSFAVSVGSSRTYPTLCGTLTGRVFQEFVQNSKSKQKIMGRSILPDMYFLTGVPGARNL